jgi:hypothetical protein
LLVGKMWAGEERRPVFLIVTVFEGWFSGADFAPD